MRGTLFFVLVTFYRAAWPQGLPNLSEPAFSEVRALTAHVATQGRTELAGFILRPTPHELAGPWKLLHLTTVQCPTCIPALPPIQSGAYEFRVFNGDLAGVYMDHSSARTTDLFNVALVGPYIEMTYVRIFDDMETTSRCYLNQTRTFLYCHDILDDIKPQFMMYERITRP